MSKQKKLHRSRSRRLIGLLAVEQKPKISVSNLDHKRSPSLLRGLTGEQSNQIWCRDIPSIPTFP
ncbi:MAG: hypothetical protein ACOX5Z_12040 [Desulfobulbus sp.]|jgi:hypothetical protein